MKNSKRIWESLLKFSLVLIFALSFLQVKMKFGWDPIKKYIGKETTDSMKISQNEIQDSVSLEVINALQTKGYLCVKEDSNLNIKFFITKGKEILENDPDWENCRTITSSDTLFPKANCSIYLRAQIKNSEKENAYSEQMFTFDFPEFINFLITNGTKNSILHELFSYSYNYPLTISDDSTNEEYECKNETDRGRIETMILAIRDNEIYVDSISLYSNKDIYSNVMYSSYPSIKFIKCKSKELKNIKHK